MAEIIVCGIHQNDSLQAVFVGTAEEAQANLDRLAEEDFELNRLHWEDQHKYFGVRDSAYLYYRSVCYWHLHVAPLILGEGIQVIQYHKGGAIQCLTPT